MLLVSYLFYAYWGWQYIPLLLGSSFVDYFCALKMGREENKSARKPYLWISLTINLGILFCFKYWNFIGTNANSLFSVEFELHDLLLPLGLSFYTLQTLSYIFDVYLGKIKPERHLGLFCLYVSFFPQLVAGPIERSRTLLPQIKSLTLPTLYQFRYGLLLIIWGFFIKLVIADNLSLIIQSVYFTEHQFSFWVYWMCGLLTTIKVYCDFMAYSEIARGVALLFGVNLSINFRRPLFAKNLRSFWQRWHISLTRWVGDYIQIPLMKRFPKQPQRSLVGVLSLILIGLWHGASWNFILFGLFHGIALVVWDPLAKFFSKLPCIERYGAIGGRCSLLFIWIAHAPFFYIIDTTILFNILYKVYSTHLDSLIYDLTHLQGKLMLAKALFGMVFLVAYNYIAEYRKFDVIDFIATYKSVVRASLSLFVTVITLFLGNLASEPFIYFEF